MLHFLLIGILLKKVRLRKCDPSGPVGNLHSYISINGNFAKKVRHRKCDLLCKWTDQTFKGIINRNFAQKSAMQKVCPLGSSRQTKPSQLYNFCSKSAT